MKALFSPREVERELQMLQRELSPAEARAALFNLVIFSHEGLSNPSEEALAHLLGKRAARIIQIRNCRDSESTMSVTARCFPDSENRGVCFQEINIQNGRDNAGSAPGTWTPLLLRDIPVYFLWYDRLDGNREYIRLVRDQADKFIVDSRWNEKNGERAESVSAVLADELLAERQLVSDLAWKRGLPLRRITASLFDNGAGVENLYAISAVEIQAECENEAHLYGLWLSSRLDWHWLGRTNDPTERGHSVWHALDRTEAPIDVRFDVCEGEAEQSDRNTSVRFVLREGDPITVTGTPGGCADTIVPGREDERQLFLNPRVGELLLDEVDSMRTDRLYIDALTQYSRRHDATGPGGQVS
ncbi:MAG TPA: glucose-6-phosphate dehydrogenase assembly protein OpcA [Spirochaetia bacterium]|nr:glucose-6-phosphate dehydrogenase assembly protein OpcA [Spirochaetia bacterium]